MPETDVSSVNYTQFYQYVTAQLQKINSSLMTQRRQIEKIDEINEKVGKQQKKCQDLENKVRLIEVYQRENFKNNQRLFLANGNFQLLERRIYLLEETSHRCRDEQLQISNEYGKKLDIKNIQTNMGEFSKRLNQIETELQKNKQKNHILTKFKRQMPPRIINCQSTKDISIDQGNQKNNLRKIQKKIQEYVVQKLKAFQQKYFNNQPVYNFAKQKERFSQISKENKDQYWSSDTQPAAIRNTRMKESSPNELNTNQLQQGIRFRNKIDTYYTQPTEKQEIQSGKHVRKSKSKHHDFKTHKKTKNSHSKQKQSKQKSKKKTSRKSQSNQKISLHTVSQYFRLREKKE